MALTAALNSHAEHFFLACSFFFERERKGVIFNIALWFRVAKITCCQCLPVSSWEATGAWPSTTNAQQASPAVETARVAIPNITRASTRAKHRQNRFTTSRLREGLLQALPDFSRNVHSDSGKGWRGSGKGTGGGEPGPLSV